ncbi:MAG TPA: transposase, partial [bacterium]
MVLTGPRKYFDKEFKIKAVSLVTERGRKTEEVAHDLGIHPAMLNRWRRELEKEAEQAFPGKGHLMDKDEEIRQLRKELEDTREERDI